MCHVLLIEDNRLIAKRLSALLTEAGARSVTAVESEGEAISAAASRPPDVIWSDVDLVDGSGLGACDRIKGVLPYVPVVFMTGAPARCAAASYAFAIVTKPAPASQIIGLFRHVASTLNEKN